MVKYIMLAIFIVIMISTGIYSRKKINNVNDFLLGGRKMGAWLTSFAYGTTYFSAVIFIGYAGGIGWKMGISATWIGIGNAIIGSLLAWLVLAKRTRAMTHHLGTTTMPYFFERRYQSKALKIATALVIFIFLVPYSASVYQGLGYIFEKTFNIPFIYCMLTIAVLTGIYLLLGGYIATAINDFIQGIIMIAGVTLMIIYVLKNPLVGGLSKGIERLGDITPGLGKPFGPAPLSLLSLVVLTSLGTWGLPQMIHKFYAIKDNEAIKRGTVISTVFATLIAGGAYFTGSFGRLFLNNTMPEGGADKVMPLVLQQALPDMLIGIIIILILSASMSTLSSLVLVSSSAISLDLVKGYLAPKITAKHTMLLMRILCVIFVAASFIVATTPNAIITLMSFSWGTIGGAFLAPFLYGLFWKGVTKAGAWAGFIAGILCSISGAIIFGSAKAPDIGAVSMIVPLIVIPIVSIFTKKLPAEHVDNVFNFDNNSEEVINVG